MIPKEHHPDLLGPDVLAVIVKIKGNTGPIIINQMEKYGYHQDARDASRWNYTLDAKSGVVFDPGYTKVGIIGDSEDNVENMNFILSKAGWEAYSLYTRTPEIEATILGKCHSIIPVDIDHNWDETTGPIFAEEISTESERFASAPPDLRLSGPIPAASAAPPSSPLPPSRPASEPSPAASSTDVGDGLIGVVEELLLQQLANSPEILQNALVQKLKAAGYEIRLTLVRRGN